ncbi:uncharacterized protein LOC127368567 [Dicentrarchus labrax]|uniref:uncharacterized protein LOC127368567 n=1 Tax=Dicentrarchus labrax TaxID=13489 RepID=UPI0021F659BC|nr:uncharacterized protein LOC127368567 [Dicentrarchus labrax]XP_051265461.1 uncharacterized protein LOC127368567 [Dicentrarchus labrax]XP_051265462.1 uncharacterized protein LOC127368567 [Dicentrarchus labrax]
MSSESGDEGPASNGNGQLGQASGGAAGTSRDTTDDIQVQMQELTRLRDELTRLSTEVRTQGRPTRSFIYVPRERQIPAFSGDCGKDGRSVEEFIDEVERVLRSRELTTDEKCDYILSLLRGPALEEVRLCMGSQSVGPHDLYSYLRNAFGEKRSTTQLLQSFYNRKQAEGEDLRDYSHALSQILSSVVKQSSDVIPNEKTVLRDQFVEGLRDAALRRELRKMARDKPDSSLLEVRNEALLWEMEDSRFHRPRAVKSNQVKSEVSETQCFPVTTDNGQCTVLDDVQRAVAHQEKQLAELSKTISELAGAVSELSKRSTQQIFPGPKPRARSQPEFTQDGQPICFKCRGVGHIARRCPQAKRGHDCSTPGPTLAQENSHPRLS